MSNFADRVLETTTTAGTGNITLQGPPQGFQSFLAAFGDGAEVQYFITDDVDWEGGIGTISQGPPETLTRDTVQGSSNGGAKVDWPASGQRKVFQGWPASLMQRVYEGRAGFLPDQSVANDVYFIVSPSPQVATLQQGTRVSMKAARTNTGAATLRYSDTGDIAIKKHDGLDLDPGDIVLDRIAEFVYENTFWQLVSLPGNREVPTAFGRDLVDSVDAASARSTLGLVIGQDVAPAGQTSDWVGKTVMSVPITPPTGWLDLNGDTLGNGSSGATHAGASFQALFEVLWDAFADNEAPVTPGGRGGSAAADFAADKRIQMPDARSRFIIGTGTGGGLTARTHGETGGDETVTLTEAQMPSHTHDFRDDAVSTRLLNPAGASGLGGGGVAFDSSVLKSAVATQPAGDGDPHPNMPPYLALHFFVCYAP